MKRLMLVVSLVVLFTASPVLGAFYTGTDLLRVCSTPESSAVYYVNSSQCRGYIIGVYDVFSLGNTDICLPDEVSAGQLVMVVEKYLKNNPGILHLDANHLVFGALTGTFPCK